jgi:hypothetical protein
VIQKLLTNDGDVLPEPAGIGQRAVEAASPLADAVSMAETAKNMVLVHSSAFIGWKNELTPGFALSAGKMN